ncbi:MAG: hypothetical protein K6E54_09935 [Bacteroidaceae bacterium]|nr:hypothetical protein [Bacteroidaceae bacterium]
MAMAQQVTVENKMDSAYIYIGQRMGITIEVSADKGKNVELPIYDSLQMIVPGIEYLSCARPDTQFINDGKRMILKKKYYVTSFDTALYFIPPMQVKVDNKVFKAKNLALKVITFDVDTLHPEKIFGNKDVMSPPFDANEWILMIWLSFIVVIITAILLYVGIRLKDNKPIIKRIKLKQHIAPHKAAMKKIEKIKEEKIWQSEDSKEYYTKLTDTLRQYIKERYGFNATEMTSYEIIQQLEQINDQEAIGELRELFQTADLVKFAKYSTLVNENDRNLVYAIEYINQTKVEEEVKPQPEEIVVEEKRSKETKFILISLVLLSSIVLLAVFGYLMYRMFYLML